MKKTLALACLCQMVFPFLLAHATDPVNDGSRKQYNTQRIEAEGIVLDGIPFEAVWDRVDWGGKFTQLSPDEGENPTQETLFKILYDDKYLYIGFRCYDSNPDSIVKRMGRRDEFPGDWVEVNIDSYRDLRTAFSFTLSVSGVKNDEFVSNDGNNWDPSWNPIWYAKTQIDSLGWTAEMKIPFSQLRYGNNDDHVWGMQLMRRNFRREERSIWQFIPQNSGVWVSSFGELRGIKGLKPQRQVEIQPYILAQAETFEKQQGNPFETGFDKKFSGGVDGKVAITSDMMLDFTINPDFGQVEADPSVVRLDGFRNFFEERRPFFIENRNIFNYRLSDSQAGGSYDSDLLFYSRRIGGAPHGYPRLAFGEYADVPDNTTILGAAKFSGKTKNGWSIGVLESVTAEERATIDLNGERHKETVEPLSNYVVVRLLKDYAGGNTIIGGMFTGLQRRLDDLPALNFLHESAYSGGFDFQQFWNKRSWVLTARGVFSRVNGSAESIHATQTSFEHLFHRPDADHLKVDPNLRSLTGHGGTLKIGKLGGNAKFETGVTWRSPELELNDLGFMQNADEITHFFWAGYRWLKPFSVFRNLGINYNHWSTFDFSGRQLYQEFNTNGFAFFKNYWRAGAGVSYNSLDLSKNHLRGGPALLKPDGMSQSVNFTSDSRKKIYVGTNAFHAWGFENTTRYKEYVVAVYFQPFDALNFSLRPSYSKFYRRQDQYVHTTRFGVDERYIVGEVDQQTFRFVLRLNYNITPDLTVQYYGQPFISRGEYAQFGFVKDPTAARYDDRFHVFEPGEIAANGGNQFFIDENRDGLTDYSFYKPDFNFVQFRSNLVVRWEYIPGSELYLVWAQNGTPDAFGDIDTPLLRSLTDNLFDKKIQNIFLLKFTYRFLL